MDNANVVLSESKREAILKGIILLLLGRLGDQVIITEEEIKSLGDTAFTTETFEGGLLISLKKDSENVIYN